MKGWGYKRWPAALAALAVGAGALWLTQQETPTKAGFRLFDSIMQGDGDGVLRYMTDVERDASQADGEKLTKLLRVYLLPRVKDYRLVARKSQPWLDGSVTYVTSDYQAPDGRRLQLGVSMSRAPNGHKTWGILSLILFIGARTEWPASGPRPQGPSETDLLANVVERDLPELESSGLEGATDGTPPNWAFYGWRDLVRLYRFRAESSRLNADRMSGP